jgi:hypothetical protein
MENVHQTRPRSELDAGPIAETLPVHMQALLQEQAELLDETQHALATWMRRRRETMEVSIRKCQAISACKEASAMTAYAERLTSSMNRIFAEMNGVRDEALRFVKSDRNL